MSMVRTFGLKHALFKANKLAWMSTAFVICTLILAACGSSASDDSNAAAPAAEATATEAPTVAPTEAPTAEPTATAAPAAEATATEAPAEEAAAEPTKAPAEEAAADTGAGDVAAGEYVFTLSGGCGCHMNRDLGGLAGGNEFEGPYGKVYAPNITPDEDTGIGSWDADTIITAVRTGAAPDEQLVTVMPYPRFALMSDKESMDLVAYLKSLDPLSNEVPEREVIEEAAPFTPPAAPPAEPPTDPVARGQQLVGLIDCGGCHTPKNEDGTPVEGMLLAGAPIRDEFAHNITPDVETGIGSWSEAEIASFLHTGTEPSGEQMEGAMAQQIERRFSKLTDADAAAIAAYLKSIPAVVNAAPSE
ncbi:MAG: c-type cytochrome [Caldilineaceae bacterium]